MKITIEIDGAGAVIADAAGAVEASPTSAPSSPSPELVVRALAIGAIDAGAAPSEPPSSGAPPVPPAISGMSPAAPVSALLGDTGAISAGAAPGTPPAPSVTVEQDPDAPSAAADEQ